jgi:hypothetical protein
MKLTRSGMTALGLAAGMLFSGGFAHAQWGIGGMGGGIFGGGDTRNLDPSRLAFRPWVSANGSYSQNLGQDRLQPGTRRDFYGYGGSAGISGVKAWERTSVGLFYTLNYQRYNRRASIAGLSQVAGVTVQHRATDRIGLFASQLAGSSLGGFGFGAPAGIFGGWGVGGVSLLPEASLLGTPLGEFGANGLVDNELFSSRVNFYSTFAGATYQPTMRWSFQGAVQAGFVRRKGRGLSDLNSTGALGGGTYRISQQTAVGFRYGYSTFSYPALFGDNRAQFAGVVVRHQLSPQTHVSLQFGGYRLDTKFLGKVAVDPEIAQLLGVTSQLEVQKRQFYGWQGTAALNRSWRQWGTSIGYSHGVNPGNGVILASKRDAVHGSAGRSFGRASFGVFGGYFRWNGLLQNSRLESASVGASTGFRLAGDLYFGFNGGYSYFETPSTPRQWRRYAAAHLTWSPNAAAFRF